MFISTTIPILLNLHDERIYQNTVHRFIEKYGYVFVDEGFIGLQRGYKSLEVGHEYHIVNAILFEKIVNFKMVFEK